MAGAFAAWLLSILTNWTADGLIALRDDVRSWAQLNACAYQALQAGIRQQHPTDRDEELDFTARALVDILWGRDHELPVLDEVDSSYLVRFGRAVADRFAVLDELPVDGTATTQAQSMGLDTRKLAANFLAYFLWALEEPALKSDSVRALWNVLAGGRDEQGHLLTHQHLEQLGRVSAEMLEKLQALSALSESMRVDFGKTIGGMKQIGATDDQTELISVPGPWRSHFAQPAPIFRHFFGRDDESAALSTWLTSGDRMYLLHGPGGIGKSALVLDWLEHDKTQGHALEGVFYWAFDQQNSFLEFMANLSQYLGAHSGILQLSSSGWIDLPLELAGALSARRILLVLDGFEQLLVAYDDSLGGIDRSSLPSDTFDVLRRVITPDAGRFLRLLCAPGCQSKTIVVSRIAPYELDGDLGHLDGCVAARLGGLSPSAAGQLLCHFAGQLRRTELRDIVDWTDCHPQLLRLIGGMIDRGRVSSSDVTLDTSARAAVLTHPEGQRDAIDSLLRRLPARQREVLAGAAAFGRRLSNADLASVESVLKEVEEGITTAADCLCEIRELLMSAVPTDLYAHDSGGTQRNIGHEASRKQRDGETLTTLSKFGSTASADMIQAQIAALVDLGLIDRTSEGYSIHPVVQASALRTLEKSHLTHLAFARRLAERHAIGGSRGYEEVELLVAVYIHLVNARQMDAASDLLFFRLIEPLFFGSARFHDLRTLARAVLPSNWKEIVPPARDVHAHILGFYARMLSKTGDSVAAVQTWQEHLRVRTAMGDEVNVAAGLGYLSQDQVLLGDLPGAVTSLDSALQRTSGAASAEHRDGSEVVIVQHAMHLTFLASALTLTGDFGRARRTNREALKLWQRFSPHYVGVANCAINEGQLAVWGRDVAAIKRAAEITLKQSDIGGYQRGRILGLRLLGIGTRLAGDAMGARDYIADALAGCRATRFVEVEPDLLIQLASCRLDLGDVTGASAIAAESLELARMLRYRPNVAEACLFSARILADSSKEAAKEWCEEALAASFGPNWRAFIIADHWKETWWEACLSDRARLTVGIVNEDWWWKSGYKPVMDDALKLWTYLGPPA